MEEAVVEEKLEEIQQRHRREKKELQSKIQALKKSASKGDKKKKKEVTEEIARLEAKTNQRQVDEIEKFKAENNIESAIKTDNVVLDLENLVLTDLEVSQRISKAQKRRNKKVTQLKERELRILEQEIINLDGARHLETEEIKKILKEDDLMLYEIASDGNCLYNAIIVRMKQLDGNAPSLTELRHRTADFLRENRVEFLSYLSHPETGNMLSESQYDEYCNQVADTTAWGGQIELRALSHVLQRPLEVIQSKGPKTVLGDEYKNKSPITLTYHRHMYNLGEHYNSVTKFVEDSNKEPN